MAQCSIPLHVAIFSIIAVMLILFLSMFNLSFGYPFASGTDQYYIEHSQEQTGSNNVVTSIVFDFRGFDTLGEATVLFIAVLGVAMFFRGVH